MNDSYDKINKIKTKKILDIIYWLGTILCIIYIVKSDNNIIGILMFLSLVIIMFILHKILKIPFRKNDKKQNK